MLAEVRTGQRPFLQLVEVCYIPPLSLSQLVEVLYILPLNWLRMHCLNIYRVRIYRSSVQWRL